MAPRRPANKPSTSRWVSPLKPLRSQRGVALLIAMFAFTLLTFIAFEVAYDTSVESIVASQQINKIKAYYAAKAGIEISLLRIMLYKQVVASLGDQMGAQKNMLDPIWSFPFMWPPSLGGDGKVGTVDQTLIGNVVKDSLMQAQYTTTITPEGGRLDINDLGSDIKSLKQSMIAQVVKIFRSEVENNEDFSDKYRGYRFEELVNNIADYVDEDTESLNGGDETIPYRDIEDRDTKLPPNRPLRTVDELMQVAGMTDDFYNVLAPRVTVFGTKGININYADREMLKALDVTMNDDAVNKVLERRSNPKLGGPFKDDEDLFAFIRPFGVDTKAIAESKIPLLYDVEFNFRIVSTGLSANVKKEITAITFDYDNLQVRLAELLDNQDKEATGNPQAPASNNPPPTNPDPTGKPNQQDQGQTQKKLKAAKGRPTVVYWEEN